MLLAGFTQEQNKNEHEQSNLGHTESNNPPWDTFPTFFPNDFGQLDLDI